MTTSPMHLDGYTVAAAIDAGVAQTDGSISRTVTAATTLVAGDAGHTLIVNDASAVNITVPENVFSAGDRVRVLNIGAGKVTLVAGSGVTLDGTLHFAAQWVALELFFLSATAVVAWGGAVS